MYICKRGGDYSFVGIHEIWCNAGSILCWFSTVHVNFFRHELEYNKIAQDWLHQFFISNNIQESGADWRLLFLDGHISHVEYVFITFARQHKVLYLYMPLHTSHILETLDLSCISQLKSKYRAHILHQDSLNYLSPINKRRFSQVYSQAREEKLTQSVISAEWVSAEINPWNS